MATERQRKFELQHKCVYLLKRFLEYRNKLMALTGSLYLSAPGPSSPEVPPGSTRQKGGVGAISD